MIFLFLPAASSGKQYILNDDPPAVFWPALVKNTHKEARPLQIAHHISIPAAMTLIAAFFLAACAAVEPADSTGIRNGLLAPCPDRPNCVSSDAEDEAHRIAPFSIGQDPRGFWEALQTVFRSRPRTRIVSVTEDYLHAEEKSRFFGFVDDIEFHLRPAEGIAAVRSASRTGYSDLGVNRKRVEQIRAELRERGFAR
jgi:uncharacterized protein (DUF1499 family)